MSNVEVRVREVLREQGFDPRAIAVILADWAIVQGIRAELEAGGK